MHFPQSYQETEEVRTLLLFLVAAGAVGHYRLRLLGETRRKLRKTPSRRRKRTRRAEPRVLRKEARAPRWCSEKCRTGVSRHAVFCRICTRSLGQWSLAFLEHWSSPSPTNAVSLEVHSLAATFLDFSSSTRFLGSFSIGCLPGTFVPCGCASVQQGVGDLVELSSCLNCQSFVPFNITKALKYQAPSASTVSCCLSQQPEF